MTERPLIERLQSDMAAAMKSQDKDTLSTLRMLKSELMTALTKKPKGSRLTTDEEIEVLQRYVKKRRETIDEMRKVGREDKVATEEAEIAVTRRYLPEAISEDELRAIVKEAVAATGAATPKEMGKVIGVVMGRVKGRADGTTVSRLVKETLAG